MTADKGATALGVGALQAQKDRFVSSNSLPAYSLQQPACNSQLTANSQRGRRRLRSFQQVTGRRRSSACSGADCSVGGTEMEEVVRCRAGTGKWKMAGCMGRRERRGRRERGEKRRKGERTKERYERKNEKREREMPKREGTGKTATKEKERWISHDILRWPASRGRNDGQPQGQGRSDGCVDAMGKRNQQATQANAARGRREKVPLQTVSDDTRYSRDMSCAARCRAELKLYLLFLLIIVAEKM